MIMIQNLHKEYGAATRALRGVDLSINQGEFVALLGSSGAGKSTLLRCINGLVIPSQGEITINNIRVSQNADIKNIRKQTAMIFQHFNLVKRMTALENVLCGRLAYNNLLASCLKFFPQEDIEFALECLRRVGLEEKAYQRTDRLSGGQQQRVGIARALAQRPSIILGDEPVASLDPHSTEKVMEILRTLNQEDKKTMLISLHNTDLALRFADRVVGLRDGRVLVNKPAIAINELDVKTIYGYEADQDKSVVSWERMRWAHA